MIDLVCNGCDAVDQPLNEDSYCMTCAEEQASFNEHHGIAPDEADNVFTERRDPVRTQPGAVPLPRERLRRL